jgi:hypothetical protein
MKHGRIGNESALREAPQIRTLISDLERIVQLRHSRLSNLIVRNLVGFMYFEEALPAAKCDTLANTYL